MLTKALILMEKYSYKTKTQKQKTKQHRSTHRVVCGLLLAALPLQASEKVEARMVVAKQYAQRVDKQ